LARGEFTSLKPAWHLERIQAIRSGKNVAPTHLQIVLSDLCNQNCNFCAYRMDGGFTSEGFADTEGNRNPKRFLPLQLAWNLLDDAWNAGVRAIELTGGGEPTVHPEFETILEHAIARGFQVGLVTNGVRLKNWELLEKLTWLRISLDAGSEEVYRRIRESSAWAKVLENMKKAGELKGPLYGVGFVITPENFDELYTATAKAKASGAKYIRLSAVFSKDEDRYYAGLLEQIKNHRQMAKTWEDDDFKVVDFFDDRISDLKQARPDYSLCGYQQFVLYIGANAKIYTCCTNAYMPHGFLADLTQVSFKEFLAKHNRLAFDARKCHHCQFNDKNRLIAYLAQPQPAHVNFV
jgi:MoaA/NifB/PqqE/SkfB family radical SAM enzyme